MRQSGKVAAMVMQELEKAVSPGTTTAELDKKAEKLIRRRRRARFPWLPRFPRFNLHFG